MQPHNRVLISPTMINVDNYPQLKRLVWNRAAPVLLEDAEALSIYERNWALLEQAALTPPEQRLIDRLVAEFGNGVLHV
jgi:hypothetical protein